MTTVTVNHAKIMENVRVCSMASIVPDEAGFYGKTCSGNFDVL